MRRPPSPPNAVFVWDLPLRVVHWSLAFTVAAAAVTGALGGTWLVWHERAGLAILGLLAFRLLWGFLGTKESRFATFFPTPGRLAAFRRGTWRGHGHSPLGALAMLAILGVLAAQTLSGLFCKDDIAFAGPLVPWVSDAASARLGAMHERLAGALGALVALHLGAVLFHTWVEGQQLVGPMVTGWRAARLDAQAPRTQPGGGPIRFALAAAVAAALVWSVGSGALLRWHSPPQAIPAGPRAPSW